MGSGLWRERGCQAGGQPGAPHSLPSNLVHGHPGSSAPTGSGKWLSGTNERKLCLQKV